MKKSVHYALFAIVFLSSCSNKNIEKGNDNLIRYNNFESSYIDNRNVDVWLPPDYGNDEKHYPVIYMHDGQNIFVDSLSYTGVSWNVNGTTEELINRGEIEKPIIVGIWNTSKRFAEYMPQDPLNDLDKDIKKRFHKEIGNVQSNNYLEFIVKELNPFIDSTYRTKPDFSNTCIMGSSMGGLISWYAIAKYPKVFGRAGCLSTHWPVGKEQVGDEVFDALYNYFDYGTETLDSLYEPYQMKIDKLMAGKGYTIGEDWITKKFEGHDHSESSWRKRFHLPLEFLMGKE